MRSGFTLILANLGYRKGTVVHSSIYSYIFPRKLHNRLLVGYFVNLVSHNQYSAGAAFDIQRALFAAQSQLVQSDQAVSTDLVAVYKALGGGWVDRKMGDCNAQN